MTRKLKEKAEPIEVAETAPPLGHNNPPAVAHAGLGLTPEEWVEWMQHIFEAAAARRTELIASVERFKDGFSLTASPILGEPPIGIEKWSEDVQGRAGDLRAKLSALLKQADNLHDLEKAPILAAGRAITGFKNAFVVPIEAAISLVRERQTLYARWLESQRRRQREEEAARVKADAEREAAAAMRTLDPEALEKASALSMAAEDATKAAAAPSAEMSRVHGALGSVTSLRTTYKFYPDRSDLMALVKAVAAGEAPIGYVQFNEVRIGFAVRSEKVREIPGCVIEPDMKV